MTSAEDLSIRTMTGAEVETLVEWAREEGWNPGQRDAALFFEADPEAFLLAERAGTTVGGGAIPTYGTAYGFMGLFIVQPQFRGRGFGRALWYARRDRLVKRLAPGAAIGMDGVEALVPFYEEGGFVRSHQNRRFQGVARLWPRADGVVLASSVPFERLAAFDREHVPGPREAFLRTWLSQEDGCALARVVEGRVVAMGVRRPCIVGSKVGPLFAEGLEDAHVLLGALTEEIVDEPFSLDVPDTNPDGGALAALHGLEEAFSCARMYRGPVPVVKDAQVFGVTTFEFG